ncbi:MAG TPA: prepilin peptidase [Noviherbaspirillum sp.]|jgi:prepilin peptidase CpaA|uniref:A24 family peptidase n=1 Tax=Noviherbaspirillum sp. TaxID=1926288 RepID=UPI002DDCD023|nr:prepilin peptidase [Noviherbaspirillum sp.]HEV2611001.1 prepilin peptidase [Noviherbaspirillum sp.]
MTNELDSLLELLAMMIMDPRTAVLFVLLMLAAVLDYRTYRIPNWLTLTGVIFALVYNTAYPAVPHAGFLWSFGGLLVGLATMLPLYVFRVMGAGDAKLMAMVGAFLGLSDVLYAVVFTFIVGGVAALAFAVFHRAFGRMMSNIKDVAETMVISAMAGITPDGRIASRASVGKLPYGVSISVGTILYVVAKHLGFA